MLNSEQGKRLEKSFIKVRELQKKIAEAKEDIPNAGPMDVAHALREWFDAAENDFVRLDVLHYAVSHMWCTVDSKISEKSADQVYREVSDKRALRSKEKSEVAELAAAAIEQVVATIKAMTFRQARLMAGAVGRLDLSRGTDEQLLGDVFSDDEIRSVTG